ncbi:uncharacterized protein E5676_scaffold605G00440 [Cucumis melo var. makuwa]|uniref:Retrotransposon gag domain-containing protein n=1 Tax=Cucumis melo var. makuwa TaxID=1194695 RepID=A0A5D3DIE3_CUCMM|nr:uncharacterized protein E6C27_scaffold1204G00450 [Cucumis melo var. makuwa]TYK23441.1 uncharacterized protein E5676_scaffold605G00440 [Cucumis melo var. makuwa]
MTEILSLRLYGTVCTQVIFPLSTLSVLRDNDAVVEIELPVLDTLLMFAESFGSNSSYFTNQVMSGLHLVFNVSVGSTWIVRGDDVCWLHAVFRAKTAGGPGGESHATTYQQTTQAESGRDAGSYPRRAGPSDLEKMYGIERLKKLGATVFEGSMDPADAEKEAEAWWKSIIARRNDARTLDWQTFRGIFEKKYYPTTYCEAKRDEFLQLKQGSLSVAEYERKYTELSQCAKVIVASESDRCRRFERGLRFEIRTPVTAIAKWTNFSQLVEIALRVEQSIVEEKSAIELSRGVSTTSGIRGREQRRFTHGVNVSGCQDFKRR